MEVKYTVAVNCSLCGGQRTVDKYHVKSPYVCRPCSSRRIGLKTGAANSPFKPTHGMRDTNLYEVWAAMKQRCQNPNNKSYKRYGGRGITVCPEWQGFALFAEWSIANGFDRGLEIDRINNDLGYSPNNCRWIPHKQNVRNSSRTKLSVDQVAQIRSLHSKGFKQVFIAEHFKVSPQTIHHILKRKQWA